MTAGRNPTWPPLSHERDGPTIAALHLFSQVAGKVPTAGNVALATLHSYHVVFWWSAGFFVVCAAVSAVLFRSGPLQVDPDAAPALAH